MVAEAMSSGNAVSRAAAAPAAAASPAATVSNVVQMLTSWCMAASVHGCLVLQSFVASQALLRSESINMGLHDGGAHALQASRSSGPVISLKSRLGTTTRPATSVKNMAAAAGVGSSAGGSAAASGGGGGGKKATGGIVTKWGSALNLSVQLNSEVAMQVVAMGRTRPASLQARCRKIRPLQR